MAKVRSLFSQFHELYWTISLLIPLLLVKYICIIVSIGADEDLFAEYNDNELKFKPVDCKVTIVDGEKALKVYVPIENIEGECTNPYKGTYTDSIAACMVMTAWIHWHITSKNLPEHVNVMVYNKPV